VEIYKFFQHNLRDQLIKLGTGRWRSILRLRLVEIRCGKIGITSVLDPNVLPPYVVADLYRRRGVLKKPSIQSNSCWDYRTYGQVQSMV